MKIFSAGALSFLTLLSAAQANFDVYWVRAGGNGVGGNFDYYAVTEAEPTCRELGSSPIWPDEDDVSGKKYGIRCESEDGSRGCSGGDYVSDITVFEMNFNKYHWTVYKDREWGIYDLGGKRVGKCLPFPHDDKECNLGIAGLLAWRIFRCQTTVTTRDINNAAPN